MPIPPSPPFCSSWSCFSAIDMFGSEKHTCSDPLVSLYTAGCMWLQQDVASQTTFTLSLCIRKLSAQHCRQNAGNLQKHAWTSCLCRDVEGRWPWLQMLHNLVFRSRSADCRSLQLYIGIRTHSVGRGAAAHDGLCKVLRITILEHAPEARRNNRLKLLSNQVVAGGHAIFLFPRCSPSHLLAASTGAAGLLNSRKPYLACSPSIRPLYRFSKFGNSQCTAFGGRQWRIP